VAKPKPASPKAPPPSNPPSPFEGDEQSLVVMARIVSAHGIQGWVKLRTFTEDPEGLDAFSEWVVKTPAGWRYMTLEEFAVRPNGTMAKLGGCEDRTSAEKLRGADVAIPREALSDVDAGMHYRVDLLGLEVVDAAGKVLGKVDSFFETGDSSVMVVKGGRERLIPFVPVFVKAVDVEARRITVDWSDEMA
jgi:16S rRNA processing protein RimM